jgi:protein TonB
MTLSKEPPPVTKEAVIVRHVDPQYPKVAANKHLEGFVDVSFTVTKDGSVGNVTVVKSDPAELFDQAAIAAVRRWRYDPEFVDGIAVDTHKQAHLVFKLQPTAN